MKHTNSDSQIPSSSISLSLPSEPPDIRNWFPSYQYESFVLDTYDDFGGFFFKESEIQCDRDGSVGIGEGNKENEANSCESRRNGNSSDDSKHENKSSSEMPDSLCSLSLLSEPPDIGNWFSSYEYESPVLDTAEYFRESVIKESGCDKDEFAIEESKKGKEEKTEQLSKDGNSNEVGDGKKLNSHGFIIRRSSFGNVCENKPISKVPDSSQSSSFLFEPPDKRTSYVYESPRLCESSGFFHDETKFQGDDSVNQDRKSKKEMNSRKLGQTTSSDEQEHSNGSSKSDISLGKYKQENLSFIKGIRDVGKEGSSILDNMCHEMKHSMVDNTFSSHAFIPTKYVEKPSLSLEGPQCKQQKMQNVPQEVSFVSVKINDVQSSPNRKDFKGDLESKAQKQADLASPGSNMKFIQVAGASLTSQLPHGRSTDREREGKEVPGNGFVTTRKSRITRSLDRPEEALSECSKSRWIMNLKNGETDEKNGIVKRKVLSEVSNFEHPDVIGVAGKWKCPRKNKPNGRPPMKQLGLERWVNRL